MYINVEAKVSHSGTSTSNPTPEVKPRETPFPFKRLEGDLGTFIIPPPMIPNLPQDLTEEEIDMSPDSLRSNMQQTSILQFLRRA